MGIGFYDPDEDLPINYEPLFDGRYDRFLETFPVSQFPIHVSHEVFNQDLWLGVMERSPEMAETLVTRLNGPVKILFTATMTDLAGNALRTGQAVCTITEYKDFEIGSTAALQRLVAASGFDGKILETDERADWSFQCHSAQTPSEDECPEPDDATGHSHDTDPELIDELQRSPFFPSLSPAGPASTRPPAHTGTARPDRFSDQGKPSASGKRRQGSFSQSTFDALWPKEVQGELCVSSQTLEEIRSLAQQTGQSVPVEVDSDISEFQAQRYLSSLRKATKSI